MEANERKPLELFESVYDFELVMKDKDRFTDLVNTIKDAIVEQVLVSLPGMVVSMVHRQAMLTSMADNFYKDNEDLVPYKPFVASVTNELHGKNPEWPPEVLFEEAGKEVRKRLDLKKTAKPPTESGLGNLANDIKTLL